jgi:hypothetical protein
VVVDAHQRRRHAVLVDDRRGRADRRVCVQRRLTFKICFTCVVYFILYMYLYSNTLRK